MTVLCTALEHEAEALAAGILARALHSQPDLVLGLATGRTMEGVYRELVRRHREEGLDFSRCHAFNLDEYLGIPEDHAGSFRRYMNERLFRRVNIPVDQTKVPDGMALDVPGECRRYEALIRSAGGIDLQLLGLGLTGHLGFNEPGSAFDSRTRETRLTDSTREQNAGPFGGDCRTVPPTALTMGLGTILEVRRCVLLVTGAAKAAILARVLEGPVTTKVPGSLLRLHPDCTVIVDRLAAADLVCTGSLSS